MDKDRVSFIVVNWNGLETVAECLDSLLEQTHTNREIIFVDNHSSDGSLELVRDRYPLDKLISLDQNLGYAEANNIGFAQAEGEYIALVNNDAVLDPRWLEKAVNVFYQDKDDIVGSVATKIINYHQRDIIGLSAGATEGTRLSPHSNAHCKLGLNPRFSLHHWGHKEEYIHLVSTPHIHPIGSPVSPLSRSPPRRLRGVV